MNFLIKLKTCLHSNIELIIKNGIKLIYNSKVLPKKDSKKIKEKDG